MILIDNECLRALIEARSYFHHWMMLCPQMAMHYREYLQTEGYKERARLLIVDSLPARFEDNYVGLLFCLEQGWVLTRQGWERLEELDSREQREQARPKRAPVPFDPNKPLGLKGTSVLHSGYVYVPERPITFNGESK